MTRRSCIAASISAWKPIDTAAVDLRPIQRQIGAFQQLIGIQSVLRRECNADTGADDDLSPIYLEWSLLANPMASIGDSISVCTMANSSPPSRATVSVSRTPCRSRSATGRSRLSPTGCPSVSFTALN
jgi:hypothetical protein